MSDLPSAVLVDADAFFSYLAGNSLSDHTEKLVSRAETGETRLHVSSEIYDDIVSALRSDKTPLNMVADFIGDMKIIPHDSLPVTVDVVQEALQVYRLHGGSRKLHYFDAYHVATAKIYNLPLVTSDRYILEHGHEFEIAVINLITL